MSSQGLVRLTRWVNVLVVGIVLLAIYLATLAPTITWAHYGADGGDLITALARGSIPHPPGFPAYLLLGELFICLPFGNPAWRLNLMSTATAAGAAGLTTMAVRLLQCLGTRNQVAHESTICNPQPVVRSLQPAIHNSSSAICAGLCLGLAPLFWSQAVITEVYTMAALFTALVTLIALRGGPAWALGLFWGVGMGVHPTLLFLAPLVVWAAWKDRDLMGRTRFLIRVGFPTVLSWGALYGLVLLARDGVPSPWGDVSTVGAWWALVSGRIYRGYLLGLPLAALPQRLLAWMGVLTRQFTPIGAMLIGLGWTCLWQRSQSLAVASVLAVGAFNLYAVGYNTADSLVYLVMALPVAALWLGVGLEQAVARLGRWVRRATWAIWFLPLVQVLLFWGRMDLSRDFRAIEWAERTLREAPPQAVLLTNQDRHTFTLWYVQDVVGTRQDVAVIDVDLWTREPYRRAIREKLGIEGVEGASSPEDVAQLMRRPVVRATYNP